MSDTVERISRKYVTDPLERQCDLMKQGFMKPLRKKTKKELPRMGSCYECMDWHFLGKHTAKEGMRTTSRLPLIIGFGTVLVGVGFLMDRPSKQSR